MSELQEDSHKLGLRYLRIEDIEERKKKGTNRDSNGETKEMAERA